MAIPEGWDTCSIGGVLDSCTYGISSALSSEPNGIPVLRMGNLLNGRLELLDLKFAPDEMVPEPLRLRRGDVLFNRTNSAEHVGKVAYVDTDQVLGFASYLLRLRTRHTTDSLWLAHALGSKGMQNALKSIATQGVSQANINPSRMRELPLLLPPLPEQKKIAAILSSVDETIAKTESVIAQLQIVKKAMMEQLLTKGMPGRHTRFKQTEIGEIPEEWEVVDLGSLLDGIDAGWSPQCETRVAEPHEWGVLKVSAVSSGKYLETENKALPKELPPRPAAEVLAGDILLARANGVLELVGRTVFVHESRERLMLSDKIMRLRPSARIAGLFMHYSMNACTARDQILELTGGSHMRNISQDALRRVLLPVPSRSEQEEISSQLAAIELVARCEDRTLHSVRSVKESLSSSLLSGEIRVAAGVA